MLETLSRLTFTLGRVIESFMRFVIDSHRGIENIGGRFFNGLLQFLEDAQDWIHHTFDSIKEYLACFFPALIGLVWSLIKLSLFYMPTIVCLTIYFCTNVSIKWVFAGLIWSLFMTGIGLTYGKRQPA